jgi:hypothetical protein
VSRSHALKTWPVFFAALEDGFKTFEVRKDDRGFAVGDALQLMEYDPGIPEQLGRGRDVRFTGRTLSFEVTYILPGGRFGIDPGWCVLGLRRL